MSVRGRQDLEIQGPRLNNTKEEKTSIKYGPDRRLDPIITEEMPLLEVFHCLKFHGLNNLSIRSDDTLKELILDFEVIDIILSCAFIIKLVFQ